MANALSTLTLVLHARNNTQQAFHEVQHQAEGLHKRLETMGERLKDFVGIGAGVAAVGAFTEGLHEIPKQFLEAAGAGQRFTAQLQSYYGSQENANRVLEYANGFMVKYGLSADDTRTSVANLAKTGQDVGKLLPAGADIAAGVGKSLPAFTDAFNRAFVTGADRSLRQYLGMTRQQLQAAGVEYDKHGKLITSSLAPAMERIAHTRFAGAAAREAQTMGGQIQSLKGIWETFAETAGNALIKGIQGPLRQVVGWLKGHQALVAQFATAVGADMGEVAGAVVHFALAAWPLVLKAFGAIKAAWPALQAVWSGLSGALGGVTKIVAGVIGAFARLLPSAHGVGKSAHDGAGAFKIMGTVLGLLIPTILLFQKASQMARQGIALWNTATKVWTTLTKAQTAATTLTAAEQEALNVAMRANVIGIVVTALAALVVGVIYAYNHFKWFHDLVNKVWAFLSGVFGPVIKTLADFLKGVFSAAWTIITKNVQNYWTIVRVLWQLFKDNVLPILKAVGDFLGGAFKAAWKIIGDGIQDDLNLLKKLWGFLSNIFNVKKVGQDIQNFLGGAFDFVKKKIDDFIKGFEGLLKSLEKLPGLGWIKGALEALSMARKEVHDQDRAPKAKKTADTVADTASGRNALLASDRGGGGKDDGGLPKVKKAPGASGTAGPNAADVVKHLTSDFGTAMTLFRASSGFDPADVKRMSDDIAALRKTDPDKAAKMQAQLDTAQQNRRDAIRHQGAVDAAHQAAKTRHTENVAHQTALRNTGIDTRTLLATIHNEIREGHYAQAGRDIARYRMLVQQDDKLKGIDPTRARADADARVHTLTDELKKAQHHAAAAVRAVTPYAQAGFDLVAGAGYGGTNVGMAPLRDALVEQMRQQIAQQMAQIKELQTQNQHLLAIEHNTRGTHDETKKVVGHTKPAARGGAHSFAQRHGVPFPV